MTDPLSPNCLLMTGVLSLLVSFSVSMLSLGSGMLAICTGLPAVLKG